MGLTRAQAKTYATGTKAALQRNKDQEHILVDIALAPHLSAYTAMEVVKSALYQPGGLSPATNPIRMVEGHSDTEALIREWEERFKLVMQENARLTQENQRLTSAASVPPDLPPASSGGEKWVSVAQAARMNKVSPNRIYEAIDEGRIVARSTPVNIRRNHLVIAETFVRKPRKPRSANKKKKP